MVDARPHRRPNRSNCRLSYASSPTQRGGPSGGRRGLWSPRSMIHSRFELLPTRRTTPFHNSAPVRQRSSQRPPSVHRANDGIVRHGLGRVSPTVTAIWTRAHRSSHSSWILSRFPPDMDTSSGRPTVGSGWRPDSPQGPGTIIAANRAGARTSWEVIAASACSTSFLPS
jgi:hypothetical protein